MLERAVREAVAVDQGRGPPWLVGRGRLSSGSVDFKVFLIIIAIGVLQSV